MGRQHGELLRTVGGYESAVDFYTHLPERLILGASPSRETLASRVARPVKEALLRRMQRSRPAPYLARSRAFFEALGITPDHARYLMVMDVFQNVVGLAGRFAVGPFRRVAAAAAVPACSTLAVWGDASDGGTLRHARNFDFPGIGVWDQAPAVVLCDPDDGIRYGFVTTRGADTPGITAFNEAGIVVTAHTRFHRDIAFSGAAIVDLGHEIVRRADTLEAAVAIAAERPIASTWGLAVSSASQSRAIVIETNARGVSIVQPQQGDSYLTCANRYRNPRNLGGEVSATTAWAVHSDAREARLAGLAQRAMGLGGLSSADLERALDDHVDPGAPGDPRGCGAVVASACTVKSIVAEPSNGRIRVSVGKAPASRGPYVDVAWDWSGPVEVTTCTTDSAPSVQAGPAHETRAFDCFVEALRTEVTTHDHRAVLGHLEEAIEASPDDPSYRFVTGALGLRLGETSRALDHFRVGIERETIEFRRGQLLYWAAQAAAELGEQEQRFAWLRALLETEDTALERLRRRARRELDGANHRLPSGVNLLIADAF
jgi:hypothetical protein